MALMTGERSATKMSMHRWKRWTGISWMVLCIAAFAAHGHAQPVSNEQKRQDAKALYKEGKNLKAQRDYRGAIKKFEESTAVFSDNAETQLNNLFEAADCHKELGETASAWSKYRGAEMIARSQDWTQDADEAARRALKLEPKLSRLKVVVDADQEKAGLKVWVNGNEWPPGKWNRGEPVDPNEYRVKAEFPGQNDMWMAMVQVPPDGETKAIAVVLNVPKLEKPAPAPLRLDYRFWVGVGGLSVGVGGIFAGVALNPKRDESLPAFVMSALGLTAGAIFLTWYLVEPPKANKNGVTIRLTPGAPGAWAGMGIAGQF